jgi:hypothetical protein
MVHPFVSIYFTYLSALYIHPKLVQHIVRYF